MTSNHLHLHWSPGQLSSGTPSSVCYAQFFLLRFPILANKIKVIQSGSTWFFKAVFPPSEYRSNFAHHLKWRSAWSICRLLTWFFRIRYRVTCLHLFFSLFHKVVAIFVRFVVPAWLALGCLAHFANLWEVTSLDICLRILFYHFQGRCWEPISSWRWRLNSCWVLALDLTMLTHFTPPPASWFQSCV